MSLNRQYRPFRRLSCASGFCLVTLFPLKMSLPGVPLTFSFFLQTSEAATLTQYFHQVIDKLHVLVLLNHTCDKV